MYEEEKIAKNHVDHRINIGKIVFHKIRQQI